MQTVPEILDALGRDAMRDALGLTASSISDAVAAGKFPARWYGPMKKLADAKGVSLPIGAFHWRKGRGRGGEAA